MASGVLRVTTTAVGHEPGQPKNPVAAEPVSAAG